MVCFVPGILPCCSHATAKIQPAHVAKGVVLLQAYVLVNLGVVQGQVTSAHPCKGAAGLFVKHSVARNKLNLPYYGAHSKSTMSRRIGADYRAKIDFGPSITVVTLVHVNCVVHHPSCVVHQLWCVYWDITMVCSFF